MYICGYYESPSEGDKAVGFSYDYQGQPYGYTEEGTNLCTILDLVSTHHRFR